MKKTIATLFAVLIAAPAFAQTVPQWGFNASPRQLLYRGSGMSALEPLNAAPHVATNAALAASKTIAYPTGVWRDDYSTGLGASPLWFTPLTGTCAANSLVNDGGYCVNTTAGDGNSWRAWHPPVGISPLQFGVDPTGATGIATAFNKITAVTNVRVKFPCGTYLVDTTLFAQSDTEISGSGECTVLKLSTTMAVCPNDATSPVPAFVSSQPRVVISNKTWTSQTDSNIKVTDLVVDGSDNLVAGFSHYFVWQNAQNVSVSRVHFIGASTTSNIGMTAQLSNWVELSDSRCDGVWGNGAMETACYTSWFSTNHVKLTGNKIDGGVNMWYGLQVNAIEEPTGASATADDVTIANNEIYNVLVYGIDVDGVCSTNCSTVRNTVVASNTIDTVTGTAVAGRGHGIHLGSVQNIAVTGNVLREIGRSCLALNRAEATATMDSITISGNQCKNNATIAAVPAWSLGAVGNTVSNLMFASNENNGAAHTYAISCLATTYDGLYIGPGDYGAGTSGVFSACADAILTSNGFVYDHIGQTLIANNNSANGPAYGLLNSSGTNSWDSRFEWWRSLNGAIVTTGTAVGRFRALVHDGSAFITGGYIGGFVESCVLGTCPVRWEIGTGTTPRFKVGTAEVEATTPFKATALTLTPVLIASLPACGAGNQGLFYTVSDGTAYGVGAYGSAVGAAGAVTRMVLCTNDGGNGWKYN